MKQLLSVNEQEICLAGTWELVLLDGMKAGERSTMLLPGTLDEAGIGEPVTDFGTDHLSRKVTYEGAVRFSRTIVIPDAWAGLSVFLSIERSRYTHVLIDEQCVGSDNSLVCTQVYDLTDYITPGEHRLDVVADNSRDVMSWESIRFSHIAVEHTQTNWNGLLGEIKLFARPSVSIKQVMVNPESTDIVNLAIEIINQSGQPLDGSINYQIGDATKGMVPIRNIPVGSHRIPCRIEMKQPLERWSEFSPVTHTLVLNLETSIGTDVLLETFGVRKFAARGKKFTINDHVTFLRGKHDACVFPLTGYAPMDMVSWIKLFQKAKEYGINHYRFHSWCPPEAAFEAADMCGMYLQPELPLWNPSNTFEQDEEWDYFKKEAIHILDTYGNHPSFVMFAWGNELAGDEKRMEELVDLCRKHDDRHLYTIGSNNFLWRPHKPINSDYWTTFWTEGEWNSSYPERGGLGVRASTPHSTRGHINNLPPSTRKNYNREIEHVDIPVIGHEAGQYQVFPNFSEIAKYQGVLRAENLNIYQSLMSEKQMLGLNWDFAYASGKLAMQCYREELEAALRTDDFGGIQLLDIQDFPGQGTALVGILDAFMEEKCFTNAGEWRQFCSETVLLLEFPKYIWREGEELSVGPLIAHYGESKLNGDLHISLTGEDGSVIREVWLNDISVEPGLLNHYEKITMRLPNLDRAVRYTLLVSLTETNLINRYVIWCFPDVCDVLIPADVYVTEVWNEHARNAARNGKKILLMPAPEQLTYGIGGAFIPDFWCYPMFKKYNPPGTMGLFCDKEHPALKNFPTENYSEWLWWNLIKSGKSLILDGSQVQPIVRTIDNLARQHSLGLIAEGSWHGTGILICGTPLLRQLDRPEALALYESLLSYMSSGVFQPQGVLNDAFFERMVTAEIEDTVAGNKDADIFG